MPQVLKTCLGGFRRNNTPQHLQVHCQRLEPRIYTVYIHTYRHSKAEHKLKKQQKLTIYIVQYRLFGDPPLPAKDLSGKTCLVCLVLWCFLCCWFWVLFSLRPPFLPSPRLFNDWRLIAREVCPSKDWQEYCQKLKLTNICGECLCFFDVLCLSLVDRCLCGAHKTCPVCPAQCAAYLAIWICIFPFEQLAPLISVPKYMLFLLLFFSSFTRSRKSRSKFIPPNHFEIYSCSFVQLVLQFVPLLVCMFSFDLARSFVRQVYRISHFSCDVFFYLFHCIAVLFTSCSYCQGASSLVKQMSISC